MREAPQPLAQQAIDPVRRQAVTQPLHQPGIGTGLDAVVQRLERYPTSGKLALQIFVAVDAELGVVGKVGAELQEEGTKILVDAIEVVVIDHGGGFHDPWIGSAGAAAAAALGPHDPRLFLGLADIDHAFAFAEIPQVLLRNIVLALAFLERDKVNALGIDEFLDVADERLGHRRHCSRRRKALAVMNPQVAHHGPHSLQVRHVDVEIHPVDRLKLQHDMITQHIGYRPCYAHGGLRSSTGPRTHRALRAPIFWACPCRLDRSPPLLSTAIHGYLPPRVRCTPRRSEAEPR